MSQKLTVVNLLENRGGRGRLGSRRLLVSPLLCAIGKSNFRYAKFTSPLLSPFEPPWADDVSLSRVRALSEGVESLSLTLCY